MKKKYFILAFMFLCLLVSERSFGQLDQGDFTDGGRDSVLYQFDASTGLMNPIEGAELDTWEAENGMRYATDDTGNLYADINNDGHFDRNEAIDWENEMTNTTSSTTTNTSSTSSSSSDSEGSFVSWGGGTSTQTTTSSEDDSSNDVASSDNSGYTGSTSNGSLSTYSFNISYTVYYYDSYGNIAVANFAGVNPAAPVDCDIKLEDLKKIFIGVSDEKLQNLLDVINKYAQKFGIDTKEKLHFFLAQVKKETGNLNSYVEDAEHYKSTSIMKSDKKKYFNPVGQENRDPNKKNISDIMTQGSPFVDGKKFFNIVYDDRNINKSMYNKLGNTQDGDGYNFRGGGALHLTGRDNYSKFNTFYNQISGITPHDFRKNPELIQNNTDNLGIMAGMWYFKIKVLDKDKRFQIKAESNDLSKLEILSNDVSKTIQGDASTAAERFKNYKLAKESIIKCN